MYKLSKDIKEFLEKLGLNFREDSKENGERHLFILNTTLENINHKANIRISIEENGEYLQFSARGIWDNDEFLNLSDVKDLNKKNELYSLLLLENYERKLIKWSVDPSGGDVTATVEINLENSKFSNEQFNRSFYSLIYFINKVFPKIFEIVKNG